MKKFFTILAIVAMAIPIMTACSSEKEDDADDIQYTATLNKPANADNAIQFLLRNPLIPSTGNPDEMPQLTTINITESSKILLELRNPQNQQLSYVLEDVTIVGDCYTMNGNRIKGYIERNSSDRRLTRSGNDELSINITVISIEEVKIEYTTENGESLTSTQVSNEEALTNLARTWNILGAIFDVKSSSIKAYEEFVSKDGVMDLQEVLDEALVQGINLTEKEQHDLSKKIKSVTITRSGLFTLDYSDGGEDVAEWRWTDDDKSQFTIVLKGEDMGNKFIVSNSNIKVQYNGNRCNLKLQTTITDNSNKNWDVTLTLKLQSTE